MTETTPEYGVEGPPPQADVLEKWAEEISYVGEFPLYPRGLSPSCIRDLAAEVLRLRARVAELEPDAALGELARCAPASIMIQIRCPEVDSGVLPPSEWWAFAVKWEAAMKAAMEATP